MEEYLEKYLLTKEKIQENTKRMEIYKKKIKQYMKHENVSSYTSKQGFSAQLKTLHKSVIQKKNVPQDIWEKYSTITPYDILFIKKKNIKT